MVDSPSAQLYAFPPIVEAIFELRLGEEVAQSKLKKAQDWIANRYPVRLVENIVETRLDFPTRSATFVDKPPMYKNASSDQTDALTLAGGSIGWTRRAPYEGWDQFYGRISADLLLISKAIGSVPVSRLGLRYVNRIDVRTTGAIAYYEDYLKYKIDHGPLLEPTESFQWLLVKSFPDRGLKAMVQSAGVEPEIPGTLAFAFDIDVFRDVEVPQKDTDILNLLPAMRTLKNEIFEAGITDRARELYRA
jgi:uncharacterized protein (TIGR04255 family)